jgi:hypothetical protein
MLMNVEACSCNYSFPECMHEVILNDNRTP